MNPKAIPRTQLLGHIDLDTREWTNGVLTVAALEAVDEPSDIQSWIICDGNSKNVCFYLLGYIYEITSCCVSNILLFN